MNSRILFILILLCEFCFYKINSTNKFGNKKNTTEYANKTLPQNTEIENLSSAFYSGRQVDTLSLLYMILGIKNIGSKEDYPEDCSQVTAIASGVYGIKPAGAKDVISVYCDLNFLNRKWTIIQNRFDGNVNFFRYFNDYQVGFGDLKREYWLGLDNIYQITKNGGYELYVELTDFENKTAYARYGEFSICSAADGYRLNIAGYSGNAGDSFSGNGQKFSTYDKDLDSYASNCALIYKGAWWYTACHTSNLNGLYLKGNTSQYATGMVWKDWHGYYYALKTSRMLIRRKELE